MEIQEFNTLKKAALEAAFVHLNNMQREAVFRVNGPLLILAGAGSGKTTVLISRIAYLLRFGNAYHSEKMPDFIDESDIEFLRGCARNGVGSQDLERLGKILCVSAPPPWAVMAITFTNKAADELKSRLAKAVGAESESILASTFHSACVRFLRRDGHYIGRENNFTIYDSDDSQRLVKQVLGSMNLDDKKFSPKTVKNIISAAKNDFILPAEYSATAGSDYYKQVVAKVYTEYQRIIADNNAMDFDDLLLETVRMLESSPELLERYRARFRYILVDEYQDTNMVQYRLIRLLAGENGNLCVVGDDDQSIYKFRGATIENILSFEKNFPSAAVVRLEQNYRSTGNILNAANEVIAKNEARKGKTLWTDRGEGDKVEQKQFNDERGEAMFIAKAIQSHVRKGGKYSDCAVLYRINAVSNAIERTLVSYSIPYRVFGGVRFYDHKEIKDMLAYLAVLNNPADDLRLARIINEPKRGIGDSTVEAVRRIASEQNTSMFEVINRCDEYAALSGKCAALGKFAAMMQGLANELESGVSLAEVYEHLLSDSGYLTALQAGGLQEQGRVENVTELLSEIKKYEQANPDSGLSGFLEDCALMTDFDNYDENSDAAVLMTVHGAKGLEFDTVFVAACEENVFPSYMSLLEPGEIEEERRLAYVAFTRAKKKLYITHAVTRMLYGSTARNQLSRFARDIPDEYKITSLAEGASMPQSHGYGGYGGGYSSRPTSPAAPKAPSVPRPAPSAASSIVFTPGMSVIHPTFGHGVVTNASKMGGDTLLEIAFDSCGTKRIMANFARLSKA